MTTLTDGIPVISLAGEIDHHTGDALRHALEDASGTPRPRVVGDMRHVTYIDSSGINIFIAAHCALSEAGGWPRLAAIGEPISRTLSLVGIDAVIDCRETLRHALTN
ncbi:STAS domain-containing protein [Streptomyces sp. NPDC047841]|uniref:STAS domain-containing protein n=1 Tax=Streptomyces sp. NPDC047841 TaxID=3154708 RepID=UPI00345587B3